MMDNEEQGRVDALRRYAIMDTPPEPNFDRLTSLASAIFKQPICTLALADKERFWFKSKQGVGATEMPRRMAFCEQTIQGDDVFVVQDAFEDARFAQAPVVAGPPHLRFYAGAPLITPEGVRIGSLCVLNAKPQKSFSSRKKNILLNLANTAVELIEARSRQIELSKRTEEIAVLARHDPLTGLANRLHLAEVAGKVLAGMTARDSAALLYLDLDGFKAVNDRHGHHCGDALLRQVGHRLQMCVRQALSVARIGGDEFVVFLGGGEAVENASHMASRLVEMLGAPYVFQGNSLKIGVSVGIAIKQGTGIELDALLREADQALYRAKLGGRGRSFAVGDGLAPFAA